MATDLSIIIPTINEATYIQETLKSILRQSTRSRFEIIVCDGGSKDNTVSIARKYARVVLSPILSTGTQLDFAARLARGKILVFLDADTLMPEDYLQRVYESFSMDKDLWACGATFGYYRKKKNEIKLGNIRTSFTEYILINLAMYLWYVFRDFFHFTEIPGCNFCIRKDIYFETEGFRGFAALPADIVLSFAVRELIKRKRKGRMKILKSIIVLTSSRHISLKRSTRLVRNYSRILAEATTIHSRILPRSQEDETTTSCRVVKWRPESERHLISASSFPRKTFPVLTHRSGRRYLEYAELTSAEIRKERVSTASQQ